MKKSICTLAIIACLSSTAAHADILPALTAIANKIIISPNTLGEVDFGRELNVTLTLPTELGGLGVAPRVLPRPQLLDPRARTPVAPAGPSRQLAPNRRPEGLHDPLRGPQLPVRNLGDLASLALDIPCQNLPTGCPPPITLPIDPALPEGTPAPTLSNFALHVEWKVVDANGQAVDRTKYDTDFESPGRLLSPSFILAPLHVVDFTGVAPNAEDYQIAAAITVSADKTVLLDTGTQVIPVSSDTVTRLVPLAMRPLEVPTVFILTLHPLPDNAHGAAAIYFPHGSQLSEALLKRAAALFEKYNELNSRLGFATWFASYVAGLGALGDVLSGPHVGIKERKNFENNLNEDDFIDNGYFSTNDIEVEDESSALLLIGPPCTGAQFWQHDDYGGKTIRVRTDAGLAVLLPNFKAMPEAGPKLPLRENSYAPSSTPNDSLSSFKWQKRGTEAEDDVCRVLPFAYP